jgi:dihydrofolate reductase
MRKVIADEWMTLDGVVQAPSYADEDTTGGFERGGWHAPYFDDVSMSWVVENVRSAGGFLLGRGTYEIFAAHWPNAPDEQQILAEPLNTMPKYVASRRSPNRSNGKTRHCCAATSRTPSGPSRRSRARTFT